MSPQAAIRRDMEALVGKFNDLCDEYMRERPGRPFNRAAALGWLERADIIETIVASIPTDGDVGRFRWRLIPGDGVDWAPVIKTSTTSRQ